MEPTELGLKGLPYAEIEDNAEAEGAVCSLFTYKPWDSDQVAAGSAVREKLIDAYLAILKHVPASPSRTRALNMLTDCRMLVNQAITFRGEV